MSGWVPMNARAWPLVVEVLQAQAEPWEEELCLFDLRWLYDARRGRLPSRRQLAKRWGWTDGRVRGLLRRSEDWWDPTKGEAPAQVAAPRPPDQSSDPTGPNRTQADPGGPSRTQPPEDEPPESEAPDPAGPRRTQPDPAGPDDRHTRLDPPSPSPSPPPVQTHTPPPSPPPPEAWRRVCDLWLWRTTVCEACGGAHDDEGHGDGCSGYVPASGDLCPTSGEGYYIAQAIAQHGEARVRLLVRWGTRSQHKRAAHLRDLGLSLRTLLGPRADEYLRFAENERDRHRQRRAEEEAASSAASRAQPARDQPPASAEAAAAWASLLEGLEEKLGRQDALIWARRPGRPVRLDGGVLEVELGHPSIAGWWYDTGYPIIAAELGQPVRLLVGGSEPVFEESA